MDIIMSMSFDLLKLVSSAWSTLIQIISHWTFFDRKCQLDIGNQF